MKLINNPLVAHLQLFPLSFLLLFLSCNGQNVAHESTDGFEKIKVTLPAATTRIFHATNGDYWFGTKSEGVFKYEIVNAKTGEKKLTQFTEEDGLLGNRIRSIQEDKFGNIYFDALAGINKYDGKKISMVPYNDNPANHWELTSDDLWFEGDFNKNGLYRYDGKMVTPVKFETHFLEDQIQPSDFLNPNEIYISYKDRQGHLWIGSAIFGACRFDGTSRAWISEREMTEIDPGPAPGVRSILEDNNGDFWFSSNINHKYRVLPTPPNAQPASLNYQKLPGISNDILGDLSSSFMAMVQDDKGDIWLATYTEGVGRFDGKKIIHYQVHIDNINAEIFSIYIDNIGEIWLGTFNLGPLKFNGTEFEKFIP